MRAENSKGLFTDVKYLIVHLIFFIYLFLFVFNQDFLTNFNYVVTIVRREIGITLSSIRNRK